MGVHGTFCQLCGLPAQHDHYVPTASGMLKIYRGSSENGGHRWEPGERPFPFGPEHAWLKDAVALPWDEERVLRGAIEDGALEDVLVFDGGEDGLAFHHACWELQGSPGSTGPAVRANGSHAWALVEPYQEQLFDLQGLADDGKAWMLADPRTDVRSRARIEAMLSLARDEVTREPATLEELLAMDRDWSARMTRDESGGRRAIVRARLHALEKMPKTGFEGLLRITREGTSVDALEAFEIELKAAVERDRRAVLAAARLAEGRATWLVYARDAAAAKALATGDVEVSRDPDWSGVTALLRS